jgi:hypothetical protein
VSDSTDVDTLVRSAVDEAARLRAAGTVTPAFLSELDARFEQAAERALKLPAFAERSARLRRIARRVVPAPARPALRRAGARLDRALRQVAERWYARNGRA